MQRAASLRRDGVFASSAVQSAGSYSRQRARASQRFGEDVVASISPQPNHPLGLSLAFRARGTVVGGRTHPRSVGIFLFLSLQLHLQRGPTEAAAGGESHICCVVRAEEGSKRETPRGRAVRLEAVSGIPTLARRFAIGTARGWVGQGRCSGRGLHPCMCSAKVFSAGALLAGVVCVVASMSLVTSERTCD